MSTILKLLLVLIILLLGIEPVRAILDPSRLAEHAAAFFVLVLLMFNLGLIYVLLGED